MNTAPITLESLAVRVTALEKKQTENHDTHSELYGRIDALERRSAVIDDRYERILEEIRDINRKLEALSEKPKKRWDTAVSSGITAIVGGGIGYALSKIFGGT